MTGEISYDLVMDENMAFVEGTYRVPNGEWQVIIFTKDSIEKVQIKQGTWDSGVSGYFIRIPVEVVLNREYVEKILADLLGLSGWTEVRGPDSMQLR